MIRNPNRRIEEAARARDVVERARAAGGAGGALAQATDRLHSFDPRHGES